MMVLEFAGVRTMIVRRARARGKRGLSPSHFTILAPVLLLLASFLPTPFPAVHAQETDRIWGRVETAAGRVYEGFIRWDRNEGSWVDLLDGSKEMSGEAEELWKALSDRDERRGDRVIELFGVRISWDDRDFPGSADSGIRFGHIQRLKVLDDDRVELVLKSGGWVKLEGGSTDLGHELRELLVEDPNEGMVALEWHDLDEIRFGPAPATPKPTGTRLYGTVQDRWGDRYTGYISWDLDEILTTDTLDGEENGRDREIPFGRIHAIEKDLGRSRVFLTDGGEMVLSGSNDVDDGHRGVQISDPGLGMVEVAWDEFAFIRFHEPEVDVGCDAFDGGHRLQGTVTTREGEAFTGWILWDADEAYSWEILNGEDRHIVYKVEFGNIATIERDSSRSAQVTLLDGRVLQLEDSNDVNDENKGIFIQVDEEGGGDDGGWIMVGWDDFQQIRFLR
jgi:hypothetical protein